jgi:hypothetical protein
MVLIALLSDSKDFCGNWSHFASISTSDVAGDGIRLQNFRHGEAPEEEREFRILAPVADEVELIRKAEIRLCGQRAFCYELIFSELFGRILSDIDLAHVRN